MGKGAKQVPQPSPSPPVVTSNPAGDAATQAYRAKAQTEGLNFEDSILAGTYNPNKRDDLLGSGL